ncbi:MAG TPA: hypothetical protein VHC97_23655 [Thermoanaerobaculia bacterium]|jgi:hypothetical protein|nr:hypothetical protein [Thermoanaerobaculia bacterium]
MARTATAKKERRNWGLLFIRNTLLWLLPVALLWTLLTPFYNRFLLGSAENLAHWTESPDVTNLLRKDDHFAYVSRRDFPPSKSLVHSFRVTDVHFHLVMLGTLFLAVPGISWRRRLENLGWALLITIFFDIFLVYFYVKFAYATRLGDWSLAHYGPFARNFWGLGKHLLDLPFKLTLPFLLWAGFYLRELMAEVRLPTASVNRSS